MDTRPSNSWRWLLWLALPLLMANAPAQLTENQDDATWFDSEQAAVRAAGLQYFESSARCDCEYMGAVVEVAQPVGPPRYRYSAWKGAKGEDTITIKVALAPGERLAAVWHTHGAPHWSRRYFSAVDTQLVADLGVPLYLATPEGELRVFRPGDRVFSRARSRREGFSGRGYAEGVRVENLTVARSSEGNRG